jgi:hypothetical protein
MVNTVRTYIHQINIMHTGLDIRASLGLSSNWGFRNFSAASHGVGGRPDDGRRRLAGTSGPRSCWRLERRERPKPVCRAGRDSPSGSAGCCSRGLGVNLQWGTLCEGTASHKLCEREKGKFKQNDNVLLAERFQGTVALFAVERA